MDERQEQIANFASNYANDNFNGETYEAYAEREDIFRACITAINWADENPKEQPLKWLKINKGDEFKEDCLFATKENLEKGKVSNMIYSKTCKAREDGYFIPFRMIVNAQVEQ